MPEFKIGDRIRCTYELLNNSVELGLEKGDWGTIVGLFPDIEDKQVYVQFDKKITFPVLDRDNLPDDQCAALGIRPKDTFYMWFKEFEVINHMTPAEQLFA